MRFTPRAEEVKRVVGILESGDYDTPEQMAKALLKDMADLMAMRDWVALSHRFSKGQLGLNWGPFASVIDATSTGEKLGGLGGEFSVVTLNSTGRLLGNVSSRKGAKDFCQHPDCGHAGWAHLMDGSARGRCGLEVCPCDKFRK
ncbi:hypothetical protein FHR83_007079 [Actinoplanes campanulatus]|uniref:Uncharacterized protein n=1 Tax=Actinoplanes campanulatus TaxID=113559 RepID=A0A7W5ANA8_9ACTN|nr:hypothetical protein [Actinoplanes campanulatus]MBB3099373.1 hypothetical protein [Actinoplanes campanulatus]GGN40244.1 hypothetical protein GCM10010109_69130 [Actinoplanes campanulatus]GID42418.1 hypothetical protein Aca09nite_89240 [Actinoplanes campanulatus]